MSILRSLLATLALSARRRLGLFVGWLDKGYSRFISLVEVKGFPLVIAYAIWPITICFDIALIPLLIVFKDDVTLVLVLNSYLNASSVALGSIILREERESKRLHKQHVDAIRTLQDSHDALHAKVDTLGSTRASKAPRRAVTGQETRGAVESAGAQPSS